jgi:hypothetical protein
MVHIFLDDNMKTIVFEVSDNVYGKADLTTSSYDRLFCEFLETLGLPNFEYKVGYNSCQILIDGISFSVETKNCTYWSKNAWSRKSEKRKDENRFALLGFQWDLMDGKYTAKVHLNKELDGDKLKAKILKAVERRKTLLSDIENKRKIESNILDSVAIKFCGTSEVIGKYVTGIHIHKGNITFIVNGVGHLTFNSNLLFVRFTVHCFSDNVSNFTASLKNLKDLDYNVYQVMKEVQDSGELTQEQKEAVDNAYETNIKLLD